MHGDSYRHSTGYRLWQQTSIEISVADPAPEPDPYVIGPPRAGSVSQRYKSGSIYHRAKIVRKILIPTVL
jgi:hypothetical protein